MKVKAKSITEFLLDREAWRMDVALKCDREAIVNAVVCDPGDEIVCDLCNDLINYEGVDLETTKVYVSEWGAYCQKCLLEQGGTVDVE